MPTKQSLVARIRHYYEAPAERVFDAFLNVDTARRFLYASRAGEVVEAKLQPYPHGKYLIADLRDGIRVEHRGSFVEIFRPHRLVYTFFVPGYSRVADIVTVEIIPDSIGCELRLTHTLEPDYAPYLDATVNAYQEHLTRLEEVVGHAK
jgi:uncharacterized protein YndB with AHSA1/START domain